MLLAACAREPAGGGDPGPQFALRFGIMDGTVEEPAGLAEETNVIPRRLRPDGFIFGIELTPPDDLFHEYRLVHHLPGHPRTLGRPAESAVPGDVTASVRGPVYRSSGLVLWPLWFDEGDPLGPYRIDVFIDGMLFRTIEFSVVSPE